MPLGVAEAALARLRDARAGRAAGLVALPGVGHLVPLSAPGPLRAAVERLL